MNERRFKVLLRYIRFDDIHNRAERSILDKLAPIRTILTKWNENKKNSFSHSQFATVDEKLEAFRGRCSFRQYIPSEPNRYGLKIFATCDAKLFYTSHMEVYVGTQPAGPFSLDNNTKAITERACKHLYNSNRNVTTDNWYSSAALGIELKRNGLTLAGTTRI